MEKKNSYFDPRERHKRYNGYRKSNFVRESNEFWLNKEELWSPQEWNRKQKDGQKRDYWRCDFCNYMMPEERKEVHGSQTQNCFVHFGSNDNVLDLSFFRGITRFGIVNFKITKHVEDTGERHGFLWINKTYRPWIVVEDDQQNIRRYLIGKNRRYVKNEKDLEYMDYDEASYLADKAKDILDTKVREAQKLIKNHEAKEAAKRVSIATPTWSNYSQLRTEPKKIDPQVYQEQVTKLQAENKTRLESMIKTPEQDAARITRINRINKELEKRKRAAKAIEEKEIQKKLLEQQRQIKFIEEEINEIGVRYAQAKKEDNIQEANRLNQEYLLLLQKQKSAAAYIHALENCSDFRTIADFESLEKLYDFSNIREQQVTNEPTITTITIDSKQRDYIKLILFILISSIIIFVAYHWLWKDPEEKK